jgi:hypothetical protein
MKTGKLNTIQIFALAISAIVTALTMLRAAEWKIDFSGFLFLCWALSPYVFLLILSFLIDKFTSLPKKSLVFCITAILMLVFTLLAYVGTLGDESSTSALIFVFAPVYLYVGTVIVLIGGLITARLFGRQNGENIP